MTIRTATLDDVPAVQAVVASRVADVVERPAEAGVYLGTLTLEATRERLANPSFRAFVAQADGEVVGVAVMRDLGHLYQLFVAPAWDGRGVGRRLWEHTAAAARAAGHAGGFTVNASRNALPVYQALGFVATADPMRADGLTFTPMRLPAEAAPGDTTSGAGDG